MDRESKQKFSRDLISVLISNIIVLISGIVSGFIVPKILGVEEYGFYKIFSLYITYGALLHFGFVDGILLKFAGTSYDDLDKYAFRTFSKFFIFLEILIAAIVLIISAIVIPPKYSTIFFLVAIDVVALNVTAYYQYISQATMRFGELSKRKILLSIFKILAFFVLILLAYINVINSVKATYYVGCIVLIDVLLTIWYAWTYKNITWGSSLKLTSCKKEIIGFFKDGIILTVSFQAATIIFTLDRQFISVFFPTATYGVYSFAYNLISIVTAVVNAVALVLFPRLRQMNEKEAMKFFSYGMSAILIVAFASLLGFQPIEVIIRMLLPNYYDAILYLKIIFPGLALSCGISIIMFTYYKVLNAHKVYFGKCCIVIVVACVLNYVCYRIFHSPESISVASIITLVIWYLICLNYFVMKYEVEWKKHILYISIIMLAFYSISFIQNMVFSWLLYCVVFVIITMLLYKDMIFELLNRLKNK